MLTGVQEIVRTWDLTKHYGEVVAVDRVSLAVPSGSIFGFLGPNGAGKSTFIKMLLGLVHPTSGLAEVLANPPSRWDTRAAIGYLPETFRFPPWISGLELLRFHASLLNLPASSSAPQIARILEMVGLTTASNLRISTYSKGMQQRIGLAQAVLGEPRVLFLDEPTSAMDPVGRKDIRDLLIALRNEGRTIFLNSHLLSDVEMICDYVAIINAGKLIYQGNLTKLLEMETRLLVEVNSVSAGLVRELSKRFGPTTSTNGSSTVEIALRSKEDIPRVTRFLVDKGLSIYRLEGSKSTLEDVFIRLVRDREGADV